MLLFVVYTSFYVESGDEGTDKLVQLLAESDVFKRQVSAKHQRVHEFRILHGDGRLIEPDLLASTLKDVLPRLVRAKICHVEALERKAAKLLPSRQR